MLDLHFDVTLGSFRAAIDLESASGETTVILGESGSGKTTVLRVLAGLLSPQEGSFVLDGDVYLDTTEQIEVPAQDRPIGYVFQDYTLFPHMSVFDNIAFGLKMQGISKREIRQRVSQSLAQVHLVGYDDRRPSELSGGQQQRVAIARALALQPRLLLLDESLSALDIQTRRQVVRELREILSGLHLTTVMVSHQYSDALNLAHQIVVLEGGAVIQVGTHLNLLRHPHSSYVAEMTGVNRFQGTVVGCDKGSRVYRVGLTGLDDDAPVEIEGVDARTTDAGEGFVPGEAVIVVIHPRNVALSAGRPDAAGDNVVGCRVLQVTPLSASFSTVKNQMEGLMRVEAQIDARLPTLTVDLVVDPSSNLEIAEGAPMYAWFDPLEVAVFGDAKPRDVAEPADAPGE